MTVPDLRIAICRRCREPERRAAGAATADDLLAAAREGVASGTPTHVRLSQCLNCCDGGHTVRVEHRGVEVSIVGIRSVDELDEVVKARDAIAAAWAGRDPGPPVPEKLVRRVFHLWRDGRLVWHAASEPSLEDAARSR